MNIYHKRFLNSHSAENVIGVFSRTNGAAKEITESWAMLEAAKQYIPDMNSNLILVIGDGRLPRTGILFAYYTKANVISIDPNFDLIQWEDHVKKQTAMGYPPKRITLIKDNVENVEIDCKNKEVVAVWPHSHACMNNLKLNNFNKRYDIAMPCCVPIPASFLKIPHICYEDFNVASPKRTIHIWK